MQVVAHSVEVDRGTGDQEDAGGRLVHRAERWYGPCRIVSPLSAGERARRRLSWPLMATAASDQADAELERASWDLEPLLDGEGEAGVERRLDEALERAQAFAARYAGKLAELDGAGLAEAMRELGEIYELVGRVGTYAGSALLDGHRGSDERGAAAEGAGARDGAGDDAAVLRSGVGGAPGRARGGAAGGRGPRFLPAPPAQRAALPRAPAERAGGEDPGREVADGRERVGAAVRGADLGARGHPPGHGRAVRRARSPSTWR